MRKFIISFALFTLALLPALSQSQTQEDLYNPITTAVTSRTIAPDAVGAGMGDIGAATTPDVYSQYWNPAKYPFTISRSGLAVNYTPWLKSIVDGIALLNASGYVRLGDYQALSASLDYFTVGDVTTVDESMTVRPYEMSFDLAYSRLLSENFSAAVGLRYMYSDMSGHAFDDMNPGHAFSADLGIYWNRYFNMGQRECQFALGLNLSDIGSKINFGDDYSYFIPTRMRLGLNWTIPLNEFNRLAFNLEASKLLVPSKPLQKDGESDVDYNDRLMTDYYNIGSIKGIFKSFSDSERGAKGEMSEILIGGGFEYSYNDKFFIRGGYHHESDWEGGRKYATFGAGFKMSTLSIDAGYTWAMSSTNPLDKTIRVSLAFDFDGIKELIGRRKGR
ncbi:MAG: type IX secretion system outer membrane channel protein PorV [Bacteroidaceae bacterium]|nr:type IX secretion system outer membrane channel protein PorV [Bacteroidaceae bacterium]